MCRIAVAMGWLLLVMFNQSANADVPKYELRTFPAGRAPERIDPNPSDHHVHTSNIPGSYSTFSLAVLDDPKKVSFKYQCKAEGRPGVATPPQTIRTNGETCPDVTADGDSAYIKGFRIWLEGTEAQKYELAYRCVFVRYANHFPFTFKIDVPYMPSGLWCDLEELVNS